MIFNNGFTTCTPQTLYQLALHVQAELQHGLQHLPAFKALDPNYVPAPFWKMASSPLAQHLHPYFVECCQADALPSIWGHGTLSLIPKPGTKGQHAADLRPITSLEPSGKAMLGVFSQHLFALCIRQTLQATSVRLPTWERHHGGS